MSFTQDVLDLISMKATELCAKGYTQDQATAAIKRSRNWASSMSAKLPTTIRDEAFLSFFEDSLKESEEWLDSLTKSLTSN